MEKAKTRQVIQMISETLDCSQRQVANLLALEPHTISNNQEKAIDELTPRTRQRITALYYIVVTKLGLLKSRAILDIIQAHIFPDLKNRMDSVVSAIQQNKYPIETLNHIAELSIKIYQDKLNKKNMKVFDVKAISA